MTFLLLTALLFTAQAAHSAGRELPLFDAHIHYNEDAWSGVSPERVFEILDEAGVERIVVSSTPDEGTLRLHESDPERVVPFLRLYRTSSDLGTWHGDESLVERLEREIGRGIYRGIGEVHLDAGDVGGVVVGRAAAVAARERIFLYVHTDGKGMEELIRRHRGVRFLWAHAGLSSEPVEVERLLGMSSNLWVELSLRTDVAPGGKLDPAWQALLTGWPDRFLVGTDTWVTSRWDELVQNADFTRKWLTQLPQGVAEMIAHLNAERLFGGDW